MLKKWTQTNREWFAEGSRPSKAEWIGHITEGAIRGRVLSGVPYIEEDDLAANIVLEKATANDTLDLLG